MSDFVHLHNHSEYSLLDGFSRLPDMVEQAAKFGQPALALTDHGNMHGAIEFYKLAKQAGMKPILGFEGYMAHGSRLVRGQEERLPAHLTLIAQDNAGYRNLLKLVSTAHLEGFYYRPRMDKELLEQYSEGVIVLSGCPSGELSRHLLTGNDKGAKETLGWYKEVFKERYYVELMRHDGMPQQGELNSGLVQLAQAEDVQLVVTNDSHYVHKEQAELQDILTCIQTNAHINQDDRLRMDGETYYIRSSEEMRSQFDDIPDALDNTLAIADSICTELDFGSKLFPRFDCPDGMSAIEYLTRLCREGMQKRYGATPSQKITERMEYELHVVKETNFADYFLVCWDIFKFVNRERILSAVRGSAASSLILYCLEVTQVDPMESALVFERFLNVERREMPDIDMDFQDDRRGDVIQYCVDKYGRDHVAQIITFGTLGAKAALRDVTRALDMSANLGDRLARTVPYKLGATIKDAISGSLEMRKLLEESEDVRKIVDLAQKLEGSVRHASTHAAGVVISDKPLTNYTPLQLPVRKDEQGPPATQYPMNPVADIGLLKMDFLGLRNLTVVDRTLKMQARNGESPSSVDEIPLEDKTTFDMLSRGDTYGVFQLEGDGMRRYIRELKPTSVMDIAAMIALYRPGPMQHIGNFIESKHGRRKVTYPHPHLAEILKETYGVIVYQDQILLIAREFGGYTLGEADILRKAMGKKDPQIMAAERDKFIEGALGKGYERDLAEQMFNLVQPFAGYAFNKAHSVSYAMIAYWTAYLKANCSAKYFAALLDSYRNDTGRMAKCIWEARKADVQVLGPDVNDSDVGFTVVHSDGSHSELDEYSAAEGIRFGLAAVKGVGEAAVLPVLQERNSNGPFKSLEDFCARVSSSDLKKSSLESLVKSGVFDRFSKRGPLLESVDNMVATMQLRARAADQKQAGLFDSVDGVSSFDMTRIDIPDAEDAPLEEKISWEREMLGFEVTESPYLNAILENQGRFLVSAADITPEQHGKRVRALGSVNSVRYRATKKKETFLEVSFRLTDGLIEVIVWPDVLSRTKDVWKTGVYLALEGSLKERIGEVFLTAQSAEIFTFGKEQPESGEVNGTDLEQGFERSSSYINGNGLSTASRPAAQVAESPPSSDRQVWIRVDATDNYENDRELIDRITSVLVATPGSSQVFFRVSASDEKLFTLDMQFLNVQPSAALVDSVAQIVGQANIGVEEIV